MSTDSMMAYDCCEQVCEKYRNQYPLDYRGIAYELAELFRDRVRLENNILSKGEKHAFLKELTPYMVAKLIKGLNHAKLINRTTTPQDDSDGKEGLYLAAYEDDRSSPRFGLYSAEKIEALAHAYAPAMSSRDIKEVYAQLRYLCRNEVSELTRDDKLVAVRNGIFDIKNQQLLEFSSDYVFLTKARVDYDYNAISSPRIQNPDGSMWDVDSWILQLANNEPELEQLLWEVIAASLRNTHSFDKIPLLYATSGANGKGSLCELLKSLNSYANINLDRLSDRFGLSELSSPVGMIISDENSTEFRIANASNMKNLATHDPIEVEVKFQNSLKMTFDGLLIQCINSIPKINDMSGSLVRRLMIVPFKQKYQGKENRLIKSQYVKREDVLRYVLHKALEMDFDAFHIPPQCELMNEEFLNTNNDVYAFFKEINQNLRWPLIPNEFIYQIYTKWMDRNMPGQRKLGKNSFLHELNNILERFEDWEPIQGRQPTAGYYFGYEPLIAEYDLYREWGDFSSVGYDKIKACTPNKKIPSSIGGIRRKKRVSSGNPFAQLYSEEEDDMSDGSGDEES